MKRIILAAAIAAFTIPAFAADLPRQEPVYKAQPVADLFTGWWLTGEVGDGKSKISSSGIANTDLSGLMGGGGLLFRTRLSSGLYLGLASTIDAASIKKTASFGTAKTTWLGRTVLQLGVTPVPNLLVYADGGVAYDRTKVVIPGVINDRENAAGWTLGAGFDYALPAAITNFGGGYLAGSTIGFDYAYVNLGNSVFCTSGTLCVGVRGKNVENLFLANFKYRFGT